MSTPPNKNRPVWTEAERRAAVTRAKANAAHNRRSDDPTLTRKGIFAHPGILFLVAIALFFFAYLFNVNGIQPVLDTFFSSLNATTQAKNGDVTDLILAAVPYAKIVGGVIAAWIVLLILRKTVKSGSKAATLSARTPLTLQEFIELAGVHHISVKVAREAYALLLPHYNNRMRTRLTDSLGGDLQLGKDERADLLGNLLRNTDRRSQLESEEEDVDTVLDLLTTVETSTPRSLPQVSRQHRTA